MNNKQEEMEETNMKMIKAIVRPEKSEDVLDALLAGGFAAATKMSVLGRGKLLRTREWIKTEPTEMEKFLSAMWSVQSRSAVEKTSYRTEVPR